MQRMGTPDDVANVVEYLAGDLAAFVSGQHLLVELNAFSACRLLSVGVGDLADKLGPGHVHGPVHLAGLRSRIILEDFHHQSCVVGQNDTGLQHAQEPDSAT